MGGPLLPPVMLVVFTQQSFAWEVAPDSLGCVSSIVSHFRNIIFWAAYPHFCILVGALGKSGLLSNCNGSLKRPGMSHEHTRCFVLTFYLYFLAVLGIKPRACFVCAGKGLPHQAVRLQPRSFV